MDEGGGSVMMEVDGQVDREAVDIMNAMSHVPEGNAVYQLVTTEDGEMRLSADGGETIIPPEAVEMTEGADGQTIITVNVPFLGDRKDPGDGEVCYVLPAEPDLLNTDDGSFMQVIDEGQSQIQSTLGQDQVPAIIDLNPTAVDQDQIESTGSQDQSPRIIELNQTSSKVDQEQASTSSVHQDQDQVQSGIDQQPAIIVKESAGEASDVASEDGQQDEIDSPGKQQDDALRLECNTVPPLDDGAERFRKDDTSGEGRGKTHASADWELKCQVCGAQFQERTLLNRHVEIHDKVAMFMCNICGSTFTKKNYLTFHMAVHEAEGIPQDELQKAAKEIFVRRKEDTEVKVEESTDESVRKIVEHVSREDIDFADDGGDVWDGDSSDSDEEVTILRRPAKKAAKGTMLAFSCPDCDRTFSRKAGLVRHQLVHKKRGATKNQEKKTVEKRTRVRKQKAAPKEDEDKLQCQFCSVAFRSKRMLDRHERTHMIQNPLECSICQKVFVSFKSVRRHMLIHTGEKPHACDKCDKRFSDPSGLRLHKKTHASDYECEDCAENFNTYSSLRVHRTMHERQKKKKEDLHYCSKCEKGFLTSGALKSHQSGKQCGKPTRKREKPYKCSKCSRCFMTSSALTAHEKRKVCKELLICVICEMHYKEKADFDEHIKMHEKDLKPIERFTTTDGEMKSEMVYHCAVCDNQYTDMFTYFKHQHFNCPEEDCDKIFTQKSSLSHHLQIHNGSAPKCEHCDKVFFNNKSLTRHMRLHTGEKPFKCSTCDKAFSDRSSLSAHSVIHTDARPYTCRYCPKTFRLKGARTQHEKCVHKLGRDGETISEVKKRRPAGKANQEDPENVGDDGEAAKQLKPFQCTLCEMAFAKKDYLKRHFRVHTGERPFECNICEKRYGDRNSLIRHKHKHTGERPYLCDLCGKSFRDKNYLNVHKKMHEGVRPFGCEICGKRFVRKNFLTSHMRLHDKTRPKPVNKPQECPDCGKVIMSRSSFYAHRMTHAGVKPFKCNFCDKSFVTNVRLQNHIRVHTGEKPFVCDQCGKGFAEPGSLRRHKIIHSGLKPYVCSTCSKAFSDKSALTSHEKTHTGIKPHACDICSRAFYTATNLRAHRKTHKNKTNTQIISCGLCGEQIDSKEKIAEHLAKHEQEQQERADALAKTMVAAQSMMDTVLEGTGEVISVTISTEPAEVPQEERYPCLMCDKTFKSKKNLNKHQLVHSDEKPFECTECGKTFARKAYLLSHQTIHTGEKPYPCDICGKEFRDRSAMKRHKNIHTTEKRYECNVCGKQFSDKSAANTHLRIHTGETPYECSDCRETFTQSGHLMTHMLKKH